MNEYEFTLKFFLPDSKESPEQYLEALSNACDDAIVGLGSTGRVALNFLRTENNAVEALLTAIDDVKRAIPGAKLIEVTPDLVGVTDIAGITGKSRQYIRKLMQQKGCPPPVYEDKLALWHLEDIAGWLIDDCGYALDPPVRELARITNLLNRCIYQEQTKIDPDTEKRVLSVCA